MYYILEVSRYTKNCLYGSAFSTDINGKIIFNCLLLISHFRWLVNYMNEVSKFHNFFLTCSETERQGVYLRDFNIVICGKFHSKFPVLFSPFFHLVCKLFKSLFKSLFFVWVDFRDVQKLKHEFIFESI